MRRVSHLWVGTCGLWGGVGSPGARAVDDDEMPNVSARNKLGSSTRASDSLTVEPSLQLWENPLLKSHNKSTETHFGIPPIGHLWLLFFWVTALAALQGPASLSCSQLFNSPLSHLHSPTVCGVSVLASDAGSAAEPGSLSTSPPIPSPCVCWQDSTTVKETTLVSRGAALCFLVVYSPAYVRLVAPSSQTASPQASKQRSQCDPTLKPLKLGVKMSFLLLKLTVRKLTQSVSFFTICWNHNQRISKLLEHRWYLSPSYGSPMNVRSNSSDWLG